MSRSFTFLFAPALVALAAFFTPQQAEAQFRGSWNPPPYVPFAPSTAPYASYPQPYAPYAPYAPMQSMPSANDLAGLWYMNGPGRQPCQIIPSQQPGRALFINENGGRAQGYIRGDTILVPGWENLQGQFLGDTIRWANGSVWSR
jgi:hypothetical protein